MPHVTFVHGIGNKPAADGLCHAWRWVLADRGLDLDAEGVSSSMVYWADLLYPEPLEETAYEGAADPEPTGVPEIGMRWMLDVEGAEAEFVRAFATSIRYQEVAADGPDLPIGPEDNAEGFERVPLPWLIKRRLMKVLLRDVHHYLFDVAFSPRPGASQRIQHCIRERAVDQLKSGAKMPGPHVILAHSLGSVIAYDCLKRVNDCPEVDALITVGSPLGVDEIQDRLRPEWTRDHGFPSERVRGRWVNLYDRLDPVAGLAPALSHDYRRSGQLVVEDIHESNWGRWRHSVSKYLAGGRLRATLAQTLQIEDGSGR